MPAKAIACLFIFSSDSTPGKTYQALQYVDGSTSCECPGWVFKRKTAGPSGARTCKHTRWIDCGMAEGHAVKTVRYTDVIAVPVPSPQRVSVPAMVQPNLGRQRSRFISLED